MKWNTATFIAAVFGLEIAAAALIVIGLKVGVPTTLIAMLSYYVIDAWARKSGFKVKFWPSALWLVGLSLLVTGLVMAWIILPADLTNANPWMFVVFALVGLALQGGLRILSYYLASKIVDRQFPLPKK